VEKGDGFSDLVHNQDGTIRAQLNYPTSKQRTFLGALDINHDNRKELFFFFRNAGDTAFLRIWYPQRDSFNDQMLFPLPHHARPDGWSGGAFPAAFLDVNGDGWDDILIPIAAGFDNEPRGVYAYDFHNRKVLWFYSMATVPTQVLLADINGDGKQEIVVCSGAPANGVVVNGFDDSRGRLFVLSKNGRLLWQKEMGRFGGGPEAEVADVDLDGKPEIVACVSGIVAPDTLPGQVFILDGVTGAVEHYIEIKGKFRGLKVCDLNRDRKPKILLGSFDGILRILDNTLSEVKEIALKDGQLELKEVLDIDGNGNWEILLLGGRGRLWVLNERLETLLFENTGEEDYVCPIRNGRTYRLLCASPQSVSLYDIQKEPPPVVRSSATGLGYLVWALIGLAFIGLLMYGLRELHVARFLAQAYCPILLLDRQGKVKKANEKVRGLLSKQELADLRYPLSQIGRAHV
jgi:hypothetical protein